MLEKEKAAQCKIISLDVHRVEPGFCLISCAFP